MSPEGSSHWSLRLMPVLIAGLLLLAALPALAAERVALVIGNAAYPANLLRNPVNDARAMGQALGRLGFEVVLLTDGDQKTMQRTIGQFSRKLRGAKVALVYYSGHGIQAGGINYMIPVDAQLESEGDMPLELVSVDAVMAQLVQAGTDVNILILDACRTNPFERRFRALAGAGLATINAPKGTVIAYATAPGTTADDGDGVNSPYTTALLRSLATPGKKAEDVFKDTRVQLARTTNNRQISWESSSLIGDFYFSGTGAPPAATPPAPAATPAPAAVPAPLATPRPAPVAAAVEPPDEPQPAPATAPATTPRPSSGRGKLAFDIVNGFERRIIQLYLAPSKTSDWEENVLESALDAGETLEMTVDDDSSECLYDLRAVFKGRKDFERRGINICKIKSYTIE